MTESARAVTPPTSYFFTAPDESLATAFTPRRTHERRLAGDARIARRRRRAHRARRDQLDNPSSDRLTFFVLVVSQARSDQLRPSVSRTSRRCCLLRCRVRKLFRVCAQQDRPHMPLLVAADMWNVQLHLLPGCAQRQVHQPQEAYEVNFSPPAAR